MDSSSDHHREPHHLSDPIGEKEDIPDVAHRGHDIHLLSFVAVMALIEVVDLLLTDRLNFAFPVGRGLGEIVSIVSRIANIFFAIMLVLSLITLVLARKKDPEIRISHDGRLSLRSFDQYSSDYS